MAVELKIPAVGESIRDVQIGQWIKHEGDAVRRDEAIVEIETDKASMELPSPADGVISKIVKRDGEVAAVGDVIAVIDPKGASREPGGGEQGAASRETSSPTSSSSSPQSARFAPLPASPPSLPPTSTVTAQAAGSIEPARPASADMKRLETAAPPSVRRILREQQLRPTDIPAAEAAGRVLRQDIQSYLDEQQRPKQSTSESAHKRTADLRVPKDRELADRGGEDQETIVPMSLLRRRIAERLVQAQQTAALLTTFNEIDLSAVIQLRSQHGEAFRQRHGVKLGFMSFFVKAAVESLRQVPVVNAEIRGTDVVYREYYHIGIAIGSGRGLVVPVLRNAERLSFAEIETAIDEFIKRADANKLEPADLAGGTFTISNGGIYGSLLSTPIVNPPQSGVLGMHAIQERPVVRGGEVVARPMMYVALTYDHRLIDGREAVTFLRRIKEVVEDPARLLVGV